MNANPTLTILFIIFIRLAIPFVVTALIVYWLHKLDSRWQAEAEKERDLLLKNEMPCWIEQGLSVEESRLRSSAAELPCWVAHRLPNGHLLEACSECEVFRSSTSQRPKKKYSHAHV